MTAVGQLPAKHSPWKASCHVARAAFVIGAEGSNIINVGIQLQDARGNDIAARGAVRMYLSDDAAGDSIVATGVTTIAVGTDGLYEAITAAKSGFLTSESDGDIDLNITFSGGAKTAYLVLVMPDGSLVVSGAVTWT